MLTEDYCSYEVAKLLKSKGFNNVYSKGDCTTLACTHQMAMKWLREEQGIIVMIDYNEDEDCENNKRYGFTIFRKNERRVDLATFHTYEEAVDAALKYCLTNLI